MESTGVEAGLPARRSRFGENLAKTGLSHLTRAGTNTLQINLGMLCNQACLHCHVEAGPKRTEVMSWRVIERLIEIAGEPDIRIVDLTGGAPEMNPHFKELVTALAGLDKEILVRCNLTIATEPGYQWLPEFYASHGVSLICSLPCYTRENVALQRGGGVFEKSITVLRRLNDLGYGSEEHPAGLRLHLVYNPLGPALPPPQKQLEEDYKRRLREDHGVFFNELYTMTNLPLGRFKSALSRKGRLEEYLALLEGAFNSETVNQLMCRTTINVGWDGRLYDCDFNQMLSKEISGGRISIFDPGFSLSTLRPVPVATGEHCLGCTAGAGSSCGGVLAG